MVDFIPTRIAGKPVSTPNRKPRDKTPQQEVDRNELLPPYRAEINDIPSNSVLRGLIEKAVEALSHGVYWDRGTILNLVV